MKKMIKSGLIVLAVAAIAGYGTYSFFSDTETSTGNNFTAGEIDLTVTHTDSATDGACTFDNTSGGPIFNCTDVKPGDAGESTLTFNLTSNPAWACMYVDNVVDSDNGCNDPELAAESVCAVDGNGELDDALMLTVWVDDGVGGGIVCNNIRDGSEQIIIEDQSLSSFVLPTGGYVLPISDASADSMMADPVQPGDHCVGVAWSVDPTAGNEVQTDKLGGDLTFYVEQARNNDGFTCAAHFTPAEGVQTLTLENEIQNPTGPWTPITGDGIQGTLAWQGDGDTFDYTLAAQGLPANSSYSLIYYADPYPGNNPGKLIGTHMTDGGGNINAAGNPDLGMDLPDPADANFGTGAKIWLIPSSAYDAASSSIISWTPDTTTWLFEGNVYIHYNDTNN
ncbi:MAG: TasA family protein [Parcubacteria group bacterium]